MGGCISVSKTELIAAFKDLIVDTNYRSEKDIFSTFVQMNKATD
jgi:3-deoxy-D-manno-octulosonic-acid transferase